MLFYKKILHLLIPILQVHHFYFRFNSTGLKAGLHGNYNTEPVEGEGFPVVQFAQVLRNTYGQFLNMFLPGAFNVFCRQTLYTNITTF